MLLIYIIYILSFGLSLFNHGAYWDDWVVPLGRSSEFITMMGKQIGNIIGYSFLNLIQLFHSLVAYRVITFLAYAATGYFIYSILYTIREIDKKTRFLLTVFFLIFPANDARVLLNIIVYSMSNFVFYFGWWLVSRYFRHKQIYIRICSLIVFFISFNTSSFLFYYIAVLAYITYREKLRFSSWKNVCNMALRYSDYILVPIIYFTLKNLFLNLLANM